MYLLEEIEISCPYCAEPLVLEVDCSVPEQRYIEDCQVCCSPMEVAVVVGAGGEIQIQARHQDETG